MFRCNTPTFLPGTGSREMKDNDSLAAEQHRQTLQKLPSSPLYHLTRRANFPGRTNTLVCPVYFSPQASLNPTLHCRWLLHFLPIPSCLYFTSSLTYLAARPIGNFRSLMRQPLLPRSKPGPSSLIVPKGRHD